jgi:hypothetical protein
MLEMLRMIVSITPPFNMVVLIMLIIITGTTITAIAKEVRTFFCFREDLEFKREMVARGISVEEVERLMLAGKPTLTRKCRDLRSSLQQPTHAST